MTKEKQQQTAVLQSAPPPWIAVALVTIMMAVFLQTLRHSATTIDEVARLETFSKRLFPELISVEALIVFRAGCALFILAVTLQMVFFSRKNKTTSIHRCILVQSTFYS